MKEFLESSYLSGANAEYIEALYEQFLEDPTSMQGPWYSFFVDVKAAGPDYSHTLIREQFKQMAGAPKVAVAPSESSLQSSVDRLIEDYRDLGFTVAKVDPLKNATFVKQAGQFELSAYGLSNQALNQTFLTRGMLPEMQASLRDIVAQCQRIYVDTVGHDFNRMVNREERDWLREQLEKVIPQTSLDNDVRRQALKKLVATDTLERYLNKKYVGQKRFSVEGLDSMIPLLDYLIRMASSFGTEEVILGMAHRGRVNVLLNLLGLPSQELYDDFQGPKDFGDTSGDLKYHRGYSMDTTVDGRPMHLSLLFNPSHLEYISTVLTGSVRARQDRQKESISENYALPIVLHGDSAFAGEGVVMEAFNMSQTRSHRVGGSIHLITNNQIGFTTYDHRDTRSSLTCADAAKIIDAPVFHVNADDLDAVLFVAKLAMDYRMRFHKDVVIDLVGYRRQGHQEADEPSATAPKMYQIIRQHPRSASLYADALSKESVCSKAEVVAWEKEVRQLLDAGDSLLPSHLEGLVKAYEKAWSPYIGQSWRSEYSTQCSHKRLLELAELTFAIPEGFNMQKQVGMVVQSRQAMARGEKPMDWGFGELMAYATLADEGYAVRMVGQDSRRGTFSHRQSTWYDHQTGEEYTPLKKLFKNKVSIYDSELNESGALGFEYGYCLAEPEKLVVWEAQFGDFYNVAQVIVDQFISSGWQKWRRLCALVMLLPHGYEGQGPEHTSARLERFLQLGAQDNMQIMVPTTPAQMYHLLRRQMHRTFRKPLIVMTPKSLLRHRLATSTLEELSSSELQLVIPEIDDIPASSVKRVILCCGKVYYDLLEARRERKITDIAIVRVEQLYPFPYDELRAELAKYASTEQVVWCQEEPVNQGAWFVSRHRILSSMQDGQKLDYVGRESFAAPSTGYIGLHKIQQAKLVNEALDTSFGFGERPLLKGD